MMTLMNVLVCFVTFLSISGGNKMKFLSTERPEVTWINRKYFRSANLTSQRYSRADPVYYLGFQIDLIWPIHNNVNVDFYFYEFVTNQYKRSFLELHFEICDLLVKEIFFGVSFGSFFPYKCPLHPGVYRVENVTVPLKKVPENIPFMKGRVKTNFTSKDTQEVLGYGQMDLEIKEVRLRKIKMQNLNNRT